MSRTPMHEGANTTFWSLAHRRRRAELAQLYLRLGATLERSAQLAYGQAERCRSEGRSDATEIANAERAGQAAQRARDLAARLR